MPKLQEADLTMRVTEAIRDLARHVLSLEASQPSYPGDTSGADERVYARLRLHLVRVVGLEGFVALLSRALALAKAEATCLAHVDVTCAGSLEGLPVAASPEMSPEMAEGYVTLLGHTIGLLVLFIGPALTLGILAEIWPDTALTNTPLGAAEETQR